MWKASRRPAPGLLEMFARPWVAAGCSLGLWCDDRLVEGWPRGAGLTASDVNVPLPGFEASWRLGVNGPIDAGARERLEADAAAIARISHLESDLDLVTEQLVQRQDELLALYELARASRSTLDLQETLQALARDVARLLHAASGFLACSTGTVPARVAVDPPLSIGVADLDILLTRARTSDRPFVLEGTEVPSSIGHRSVLGVPVRVREGVLAVLGCARDDQSFDTSDVKLARAIAEQAGAQIENALLHADRVAQARLQAEMQLAARVQADLLPQGWPDTSGVACFATTRPASVVGGDFYDVVGLGPRGFFLCLGDVSGKGVPAALVMSMMHAVLRGAIGGRPGEPDTLDDAPAVDLVLRRAVEALYDDFSRLEMFATTFLARYHRDTRELHYINAGHVPVVHRPVGGSSAVLMPDEPPVGMLPHSTAGEHVLLVEPGTLLVAASDGINEATNAAGEQFGLSRLLEVIDGAAADAPAAIAQAVLSAVAAFQCGRPPDDDQTLLIVKGVTGTAHD